MTSRDATLEFRPIAAAVVRTARRDPWRILAVSIVVSAVAVAAELAADRLLDRMDVATALAGSLSASVVSLLGAVFLSGFLSRLVSETGHGEHDAHGTRIRDVLRSLPWGSLILADLMATLIIVAGLLALIIPGLVAITLLAVVGPVIEIEHRHAWAGLRRSAHLVRPRFWRAAAYGTLPILLLNGIVAVLPDPSGTTDVRDHPDRPVGRRGHRRLRGRPAAGGALLPPHRRRPRRGPPGGPRGGPACGLTRWRRPGPGVPGDAAR